MQREGEAIGRGRTKKWWGTDGSVSVLLIFILAVMFLFMSVLIDYARIAAIQWRTELIAQSGIRSVMSAYEPVLQERYGLFGYGETDPALITEYVTQDQTKLKSKDTFSWVNAQIESHTTTVTRPLGRHNEFERQIFEDMKYKAPVQIAFELGSKLKPMADVMKEAAQVTDMLAQLQKIVNRRNDALFEALRLQKLAQSEASGSDIKLKIAIDLVSTIPNDPLGKINTAADIAAQYDDYITKKRSDDSLAEDQKLHTNDTDAYEKDSRLAASQLRGLSSQVQRVHADRLNAALQQIEKAREANDEIVIVIRRIRQSNAHVNYDRVNNAATPTNAASTAQLEEILRRLNSSADDLVLPQEFMHTFKQELLNHKLAYAELDNNVGSFQSMVGHAVGGSNESGLSFKLKTAVVELWKQWNDYEQNYVRLPNVITTRERKLAKLLEEDNARRFHESNANKKLNQASDMLFLLANLDSRLAAHREGFTKVNKMAESIAVFNSSPLPDGQRGSERRSDPISESKLAMDQVTSLFGALADGLEGMRDRTYRNEYAFLYFTSYDPTKLQSMFQSGQPADDLIQSLSIHNQELEYILYGQNGPIGNICAAYSEIFLVRLAIRTMEGLVEYRSLVHPLVILAAAVAHGLEQAIQDMILLVTQNEVPLSEFIPAVTLSYSDHLRLFMMLHGKREAMMNRMLGLIQYNTGVDPTTRGTYGEVDLQMSAPVWFLPGLMKWLGHAGLWDGEFSDGRYRVSRKSVFSY
ncbi:acyl-CoA cholesterol acyltransferase [Paenibacillus sp. 481]|nr:acyl-CoA cholesterol acyltransferase [Paenibacillus sp. 481]